MAAGTRAGMEMKGSKPVRGYSELQSERLAHQLDAGSEGKDERRVKSQLLASRWTMQPLK